MTDQNESFHREAPMKNILIVLVTLSFAACSTTNGGRSISSVAQADKNELKVKAGNLLAGADVLTQKTLHTCSSEKWSDIRIIEEKKGGAKSYGLIIETGSRDRSSVGAYTEGLAYVVFGLSKLTKDRKGNVTISGEFQGTQPVNNSKVSLFGKIQKREDGSPYLRFSLIQGEYKVETSAEYPQDMNYSFAFFAERMKSMLFDSGVASSEQEGTLECSVD